MRRLVRLLRLDVIFDICETVLQVERDGVTTTIASTPRLVVAVHVVADRDGVIVARSFPLRLRAAATAGAVMTSACAAAASFSRRRCGRRGRGQPQRAIRLRGSRGRLHDGLEQFVERAVKLGLVGL